MLLAKCPNRHDCSNSTVAWRYKDPPQLLIFRPISPWKCLGPHQHGTAFTFCAKICQQTISATPKSISCILVKLQPLSAKHPLDALQTNLSVPTKAWHMSARKSKDQSLPQGRESRTWIILNHLKHNFLFSLGLLGINYFSSSILFVGMWLASCLRQSSGMVMRGRLKQVVRGSGAVLTKEVIIAWRGKCQQADAAIGSVASKLTTPDLKRMSSLLMVCPLGISSKATWTYLRLRQAEKRWSWLCQIYSSGIAKTMTCRLAGWSDETADQVHPWKFTPSSALSQIFLSYSNQRFQGDLGGPFWPFTSRCARIAPQLTVWNHLHDLGSDNSCVPSTSPETRWEKCLRKEPLDSRL